MALVNMKRPKPKRSKMSVAEVPEAGYEKYSYGLRISLDNKDIEKLGDQLSDIQLGGMVTITAKAEVVGMEVGGNLYDGEKHDNSNINLQIQKLQITPISSNGDNSLRAVKRRLRGVV